MEQSILISTKKVLQIGPDDESFDLDLDEMGRFAGAKLGEVNAVTRAQLADLAG